MELFIHVPAVLTPTPLGLTRQLLHNGFMVLVAVHHGLRWLQPIG